MEQEEMIKRLEQFKDALVGIQQQNQKEIEELDTKFNELCLSLKEDFVLLDGKVNERLDATRSELAKKHEEFSKGIAEELRTVLDIQDLQDKLNDKFDERLVGLSQRVGDVFDRVEDLKTLDAQVSALTSRLDLLSPQIYKNEDALEKVSARATTVWLLVCALISFFLFIFIF